MKDWAAINRLKATTAARAGVTILGSIINSVSVEVKGVVAAVRNDGFVVDGARGTTGGLEEKYVNLSTATPLGWVVVFVDSKPIVFLGRKSTIIKPFNRAILSQQKQISGEAKKSILDNNNNKICWVSSVYLPVRICSSGKKSHGRRAQADVQVGTSLFFPSSQYPCIRHRRW
jgi:hypothetical protein